MTKIMFFYLRISKTFIYFKNYSYYFKDLFRMILNNDFIKVWHGFGTMLIVARQRRSLKPLFRMILNNDFIKVWHGFGTMLIVARQRRKIEKTYQTI